MTSFIRSTETSQLISRDSVESLLQLKTSHGFKVDVVYPAGVDGHAEKHSLSEVHFLIELSMLSFSKAPLSIATDTATSRIQDISVWKDFLSVKMMDREDSLTEQRVSPALSKCLLVCFQNQVNTLFIKQCDANDTVVTTQPQSYLTEPSSPPINWFGIIENAALSTLPLILFVRSLHVCLHRRNTLLLSCITPKSNSNGNGNGNGNFNDNGNGSGHTTEEAKPLCEQVVCIETRMFSDDKVSLLLQVTKKLKSSVQTEKLLSSPNGNTTDTVGSSHGANSKRNMPDMSIRDIHLDVPLDASPSLSGASSTPTTTESRPKTLQIVKMASAVYSLEYTSRESLQDEAYVQRVLDNFVSGLFQC